MAIGTPVLVASSSGQASETANSATVTTANSGSAVAAGDLIVLLATARVASTLTTTFSASAGGLTYTTELDCGPSSLNNGAAGAGFALNPSGVASGTNWTATFSASATRKALNVYSVSGLDTTSSVVDSALHNNVTNPNGGTGNDTTTADAASAQADEIFFHFCKHSTSVNTVTGSPSAGWTELTDRIVGASTFMQDYSAYRIVSATETPSITVTFTTTGTNWIGGIVGFKAATAVTVPQEAPRKVFRSLPVQPRRRNQIAWR